jgi:hypothetical protein
VAGVRSRIARTSDIETSLIGSIITSGVQLGMPQKRKIRQENSIVAVAIESYTAKRKAAFLLENAVDAADYAKAVKEVRRMGIDPDSISRTRPRS